MATRPEPEADLDELRRRLYLPGAGPLDVARYEEALAKITAEASAAPPEGAPEVEPQSEPEPDGAAAPSLHLGRRVRRRALLVGGAIVASVALILAIAVSRPTRSPEPAVTTVAGEGLPTTVEARSEFIRAMRAGLVANLRFYLLMHPAARPTALNGVTRVDSAEYSHFGPGSVELDPSSLAARGGHVTLIVMTDRSGDGRWLLDREALREDIRGFRQVIATSGFGLAAGAPVSWSTQYVSAPMRLTVTVPRGVQWDAVVVFTD